MTADEAAAAVRVAAREIVRCGGTEGIDALFEANGFDGTGVVSGIQDIGCPLEDAAKVLYGIAIGLMLQRPGVA